MIVPQITRHSCELSPVPWTGGSWSIPAGWPLHRTNSRFLSSLWSAGYTQRTGSYVRRSFSVSCSSGKTIFFQQRNSRIMNDIQYVYDAGGHKKGVIIPIELWERTLQVKQPRTTSCNLSEYYGMYRDLMKDPGAEAKALRDEWNRVWLHISSIPIFSYIISPGHWYRKRNPPLTPFYRNHSMVIYNPAGWKIVIDLQCIDKKSIFFNW